MQENQQRFRQLAGSGLTLAQGVGSVASQASQQIGQGSRLAGSVIKAANDTAPLILDVSVKHEGNIMTSIAVSGYPGVYRPASSDNRVCICLCRGQC